jgi:hypothetical protein
VFNNNRHAPRLLSGLSAIRVDRFPQVCPSPVPQSVIPPVQLTAISILLLSLPSDTFSGMASQNKITQGVSSGTVETGASTELTLYTGENYRHLTTIDMLTDNALLEIFDFYRNNHDYAYSPVWKWHILVHVCQRWRQIIFQSPRRLDLQVLCTFGTPVRKHLSIWPDFPIALSFEFSWKRSLYDEDNLIAALEHPSRVFYLRFNIDLWSEKMATAMQKPFPTLRNLIIVKSETSVPVPSLPDGFLGRSAPCLQNIKLYRISFPALPMLLSSASNLVHLHLRDIPQTGHISSKAMAACLAALPRLKSFHCRFQPDIFRPDLNLPSPITRAVLPALEDIDFQGRYEYLEDLVARIDCPRLNEINISDLYQVDFQLVQLSEFFDRSLGPEKSPFRHVTIRFFDAGWITVETYHPTNHPGSHWHAARAFISCQVPNWQISLMSQVLSQLSPILSTTVHLATDLHADVLQHADDHEWVHLLRQLSMVEVLSLDEQFARYLACALKSITGEMVAEALSSLDLIYLEGQPTSSIQKFVVVRQLSGRPVTVVDTESEFDERLKDYVGK